MRRYTVHYSAGPYSGTRSVEADDEDHAIAKVRAMIRKQMTLPMYADSYRILGAGARDDDYREGD